MGPRGGYSGNAKIAIPIEPPSREPQSLMLPVHHLGHRFVAISSTMISSYQFISKYITKCR
jgi:hypothetical protein